MQKSVVLRIASIIMMVAGIIGVVSNLISGIAVNAATNNVLGKLGAAVVGFNPGLFWFGIIIATIASVGEIVAGVMGKNNNADPAKAKTLMMIGAAIAVLALISNILVISAYKFEFSSFISILSGVGVPVFFTIAAFQVSKDA